MAIAPQMRGLEEIAPGLFWAKVYWMDGAVPKGKGETSEVQAGVPHLGWGQTFVVDKDPESKMVMLFSPYAFEGFQVSRKSFEYTGLRPAKNAFDRDWHAANFLRKWTQAVNNSWQRDFDNAVVIMRMLGLEIPDVRAEGFELKVSGGKEADVLGLLKPVKRKARTGQILAFFWPEQKSIREAMAEFGMSRSNVLSQLYLLQKNHGVGYKLQGDQAIISMPPGCEDPWAEEA